MKKHLFLGVLAAAMLLSGCAKKSKGPVTVEIWHTYNGTQQEYLVNAAEKFNQSQSDYVVKVLAQDYSGFADTVYNAVANGIGPSIIFNYGSTAVSYAKEGLAVDISKYIKEDIKKGDSTMQDIIDSLPSSMQTDVKGFEDGGIYYLPGCTTGPVFFYNKTLFDELGLVPPKDWKELEQVCKTIYEKKGIAGYHADGLVDNIQTMIMQSGMGYIDVENKKVLFGGEKMEKIYPKFITSFESWLSNYWNLERNDIAKNAIIFNIENEKDYYKAIIYYISGMTDNFAIEIYNEIIGF